MIDFKLWYTAVLLIIMTVFLVKEIFETDIVLFSILLLLLAGGVINLDEMFVGFSNHGMLTVALLFVVAAGLQNTGGIEKLEKYLLGKNSSGVSKKLLRFLPIVGSVSAFFNNTPIVAMLIPMIRHWTKKHHMALSKFLIPLSYATILGGLCTLIGTSTNLVIHGLMLNNGMKGWGFFELSPVGIPVAIFGILFIATVGHRLLPDRKEPALSLGENTREFVVVMRVEPIYPHIGKSIEDAGLRHLKGLFLFQVERNSHVISPASPDELIYQGDRLFFTGLPETIMELQKIPGLSVIKDASFDLKNYDSDTTGTFEVVISPNSPLIGKNVRESNFRSVYDAVIIAIHRSGERISRKVGDIVMHAGDTLLIIAKKGFMDRWYHSRDFYLVSRSVEVTSKPHKYLIFSMVVLITMIIAMGTGVIPILAAVAIAAVLLLITRCITPHDARTSIDLKVLLVIACSFGISKGVENSGLANLLAKELIQAVGILGPLGILAGVYFCTNLYTEIITNNAAAAMIFPIAISVAQQAQMDPRPLLLALTIAASASFSTPIGYQTNMMVYGPGGYKFKDFLKIGIPLNISIGILTVAIIYLLYF